jgi:hypothetical protein
LVAEGVDRRGEVGGNLAEEKELLSLAWREVAGDSGGGNGGLSRLWWLQLEEEEKERAAHVLQRGEEGWKEKRGESHGGCLAAGWLPMVELVFMVVYSLGLLVFSLEKAAVAEVERAAEGCRGKQENGNRGKAGFL